MAKAGVEPMGLVKRGFFLDGNVYLTGSDGPFILGTYFFVTLWRFGRSVRRVLMWLAVEERGRGVELGR